MAKKKEEPVMTLSEAVENLSSMAEIEPELLMEEADLYKQGQALRGERREWLDLKDEEKTFNSVTKSFRTVHEYLKDVYRSDQDYLKDADAQKGIHAMMQLAGEAAEKINACTGLFKKAHKSDDITETKEFKDLHAFYLDKIVKKFQKQVENEEAWQEKWGEEVKEDILDIKRRGLKELQQVRKDRKYEFFYIKKEDGLPFFNRNLIRHIRLVTNFDEMITHHLGEDPFLKVRLIQDKEAHHKAKTIREKSKTLVKNYLKDALKFKNQKLITVSTKALISLFLSSNHRNLLQNTLGKSCLNYFQDFLYYIRECLISMEYLRLSKKNREDVDRHLMHAVNMMEGFCLYLYLAVDKKDDTLGLIHLLAEKGSLNQAFQRPGLAPLSLWNGVLDYQENIQNLLKKYPNGPLMLLIDLFEEKEQRIGFDPFKLQNHPSKLYALHIGKHPIDCLRLPSPTYQEMIDQADLLYEFQGFLEVIKQKKQEKLLIINLQDRTSWEEHARVSVLENLSEEYGDLVTTISLPKSTPFYNQKQEYLKLNQAAEFKKQLLDQILSGEDCGFFFPKKIKKTQLRAFTKNSIEIIHKYIFNKDRTLSQKNRLDFIEIVYWFLSLKLIEWIKPTKVSFSCKDSIDVGQLQSVSFFAFLRMMGNESSFSEEERDFILWMIFAPALLIRNRSVDAHRLTRTMSALSVFSDKLSNESRIEFIKEISPLFDISPFKSDNVTESI